MDNNLNWELNITQGSHIDEDSRFQAYDTMSISKEEFIASILHLYTLKHKQKPEADVQKHILVVSNKSV
jgi:hypothetical protein